MRITNAELFASKATTREMIQSRRYLEHLKEFGPLLKNWLARFETISGWSSELSLTFFTELNSACAITNHSVDGIRIYTFVSLSSVSSIIAKINRHLS